MKKNHMTALVFIFIAFLIIMISGKSFMDKWEPDVIVKGLGVTKVVALSDYFPELKGKYGDSSVYFLEGKEPGGTIFILGGTHPNEPASMLTAVLWIENAIVERGRVIVLPQANLSGFSHNDPQEGSPQNIYFTTPSGVRRFRYGSRATNPIHQWPDPDIYINQHDQALSGSDNRNLNRGYPGKPYGSYTEKVCYGIMELIRKEKCDLSFDLHEASPEYPVINAIVAPDRSLDIASMVVMDLQMEEIEMNLELSPPDFHGLSHREWGDYSDTMPILMETANASQGRLRGRTDENLVLTGKDKMYVQAAKLGRLYVPYDEDGHPIEERVGRHIFAIETFISNFNMLFPDKTVEFSGIPSYQEILKNGYGFYLKEVK